ncbi:MAG: DUF4091 domain-containing protein [Draconibacterium sp.]|nr:DUF4091 domain-containing protein [Draconibacterium sp.]
MKNIILITGLSLLIVSFISCTRVKNTSQENGKQNTISIHLEALHGSELVSLTGSVSGSETVSISSARNEVESFQVVVKAQQGRLHNVDASLSLLTNEGGNTLSAECVELFCGNFVPVRTPDPRSDMKPGMWADALVPRINPYTGEPVQGPNWSKNGFQGERFRGRHFDVWEDQQQPFWVDVSVPKDAAPGIYTGLFTVWAENADSVNIPVEIEVWDFALPDGPTLENHFGGFARAASFYGLKADSEEFYPIEDRFIEMIAAHRIDPQLPKRLTPSVGKDGSVHFDKELDKRIDAFVTKYHKRNIEVPRAPFRDMLGADRDKATAFYRSWYNYIERKGWEDRAYLYMFDEPLRPENYESIRQLGAFVDEVEPNLRRLVVEQPYPRHPNGGTLDGSLDIWVSLFGYIDEASIQRVLEAGDEVWLYTALVQSIPKFHPNYETYPADDYPFLDVAENVERPPYWEMDFPLLSYRIAPWLNYRYGATGLLYWSTCYWESKANIPRNPWDNPTHGDHWNGEGMLFYPGTDVGIEGPIASVRLKNLRDGMEDYEYFVLLKNLGGEDIIEEIVKNAVPTWGTWDQNSDRLLERRRKIAQEIIRLGE